MKVTKKLLCLLTAFIFLGFSKNVVQAKEYKWEGEGTIASPYLINDYDDLMEISRLVGSGNDLNGIFFRQTSNIELYDAWSPIGTSSNGDITSFKGVYDGSGNYISGLHNDSSCESEFALFKSVGGVIANLGLTNVEINADNSAPFTCYADADEKAKVAIINCYSTGTISGNNCAGVAFSFNRGSIVNSFSDIAFDNSESMGIVFLYGDIKLYHCLTTCKSISPAGIRQYVSKTVTSAYLRDNSTWKNNPYIALSQILYGNHFRVELKEWKVNDFSNSLVLSPSNQKSLVALILDFFNEYLFGILLFLLVLLLFRKHGKIEDNAVLAGLIIIGLIAYFIDFTALFIDDLNLNLGFLIGIFLCNCLFIWFVRECIKRHLFIIHIPVQILIVMLVVAFLAMVQIDVTPRYDASLYYGSFVEACSWYRGDLFTFIGAFTCWRAIQGIALLVAPLEFANIGEFVGTNISTLLILEVTIVVVYKTLKRIIPDFSNLSYAVMCFVMVFSPYQFGLMFHFTGDNYLAYFAFWLIYSYLLDNDYLIAFCGWLLVFSKEPALAYYVVFLVTASIARYKWGKEADKVSHSGDFLEKVKKIVIWSTPVVLWLVNKTLKYQFIIQNFLGEPDSKKPAKLLVAYANNIGQSFIWNFRWIFTVIITLFIFKLIFNRKKVQENFSSLEIIIAFATATSGLSYVIVLLIYNGIAELPRYTSLLNTSYFILLVMSLKVLFCDNRRTTVSLCVLGVLFLIESYITIDPIIILGRSPVETGGLPLYKLSFDRDTREYLGKTYGRGYQCIGDLYAYNTQYLFYNSLIEEMVETVEPTNDAEYCVLDIAPYELHLSGSSQYTFYWDTEKKKMVYQKNNKSTIKIKEQGIVTDSIEYVNFDNDFYLIVPSRVDEAEALMKLSVRGYAIGSVKQYHNVDGAMRVYHLVLTG